MTKLEEVIGQYTEIINKNNIAFIKKIYQERRLDETTRSYRPIYRKNK